MPEITTHTVGIIMNGVTGRMGLNQHLKRSIWAIIEQGGGYGESTEGVGKTGVVGVIRGRKAASGKVIGLRADMDALPIEETSGAAYASKTPGKMHACGHDGHTTILVGAARVLSKLARQWALPRPVTFFFQPAEEGGAGAKKMIDDGCLSGEVLGPPVTGMFGLHGWPRLPQGVVAGFVGPNGAGKTTTMAMLFGLVRPSAGDGEVLGDDIATPAAFLPRVGAMIESPAFYPALTGRENLRMFATVGRHAADRIPALLDTVGLGDRGDDRYRTY